MTDDVRTRTRAPAAPAPVAAPAAQPAAAPAPGVAPQAGAGLVKYGADAEAARVREAQRQEQRRERRNKPFRYKCYMGAGTGIDTKTGQPIPPGNYIILDSDIAQCPVFYEHMLADPDNEGRHTLPVMCVKEIDNCPVCQTDDRDSSFVMVMSVLDINTRKNRRTGELIPWTKKLLAVKSGQQEWFKRQAQRTGNLRGLHVVSFRDTNQMSAAIGQPEVQTQYTEEQLVQAFSHAEVRGVQGNVIKPANSDLYPFDYSKEFNFQETGESLRQKFGGVIPAGSQAETAQEWGAAGTPAQPAPAQNVAIPAVQAPQNVAIPAAAPAAQPLPGGAAMQHAVQPVAQTVAQPAPAPVQAVMPATVSTHAGQPAPGQPVMTAPQPVAQPVAQPAPAPAQAPAAAPAPSGIQPVMAGPAPQPMTPPSAGDPPPDLDDEIPF